MWKWLKKTVSEFIEIEAANWEAAQRGTLTGILPALIIMGAAMAAKKIAANRAKNAQAKAANKSEEGNLQAKFESDTAFENNKEDDRLARMQQVAGQLQGARALNPAVIAAALRRRQKVTRKGVGLDRTKGLNWELGGELAGTVGDMAGAYMAGANPNAVSGASKAMGAGGGAVAGGAFNPGIGAGMFQRGGCPPGQIC